jgi:hypothetical protein
MDSHDCESVAEQKSLRPHALWRAAEWKGALMTVNENMEIEGALSKPFRLWHANGQSEFVALIAEADSLEEINRVRRRGDWRYQITRNGMPVDSHGYPILQLPGQDLTEPE